MAAVSNVIPTIWSARFTRQINQLSVMGVLFGRDYQAELRDGNKVTIPTSANVVTVGDYTRDTDIAAPNTATTTTQDLVVDQAKYTHIYVDDLDRVQARPSLIDRFSRDAAQKIIDGVDTYLAGLHQPATGIDASRIVSVGSGLTKGSAGATVLRQIKELRVQMKEANIPDDVTFILILPPRIVNEIDLFLSGLSGTDANATGFSYAGITEQTLRNGFFGRVSGFEIFESNNIPFSDSAANSANNVRTWRCPVGTTDGAQMVDQFRNVEAYRPEKRFGDAIKALYVYGAKVTDRNFAWSFRIPFPVPTN